MRLTSNFLPQKRFRLHRLFSEFSDSHFTSNPDKSGVDLVFQRAFNILNNFTENNLSKVLHFNCGGHFLSYFGQFDVSQLVQYKTTQLIDQGIANLANSTIRKNSYQFVVYLEPIRSQPHPDLSLSPTEFLKEISSFAATDAYTIFGFPEKEANRLDLVNTLSALDQDENGPFQFLTCQHVICKHSDLLEHQWWNLGEKFRVEQLISKGKNKNNKKLSHQNSPSSQDAQTGTQTGPGSGPQPLSSTSASTSPAPTRYSIPAPAFVNILPSPVPDSFSPPGASTIHGPSPTDATISAINTDVDDVMVSYILAVVRNR